MRYVAGDYGEDGADRDVSQPRQRRNAGQATPDLAILPGVRMLRTSEPERDAKLAEAMIKLVTGGEPIQRRPSQPRLLSSSIPKFKLTISRQLQADASPAR